MNSFTTALLGPAGCAAAQAAAKIVISGSAAVKLILKGRIDRPIALVDNGVDTTIRRVGNNVPGCQL